jgi:hypothetical protein
VPPFVECLAFTKRLLSRLQQSLWHAPPRVHEAFPDDGAEPASSYFLEDDIRVMDRLHGQHSRGPAPDQLCQSELRGNLKGPFVMSRLQWPDSLFQPVEQSQVVGDATHDCLAEVNVGLYKPGQYNLSCRI